MKISKEKMSLENISKGAIVERFDLALDEIIKNIQDPNTEAEAVRAINIVVKIKPDETRDVGFIGIEVTPKPAPYKPIVTRAVFDKGIDGSPEVNELFVPEQMPLDFNKKNVTPIDKGTKKNA